ncbi:MAG: uL30 family ribosomal protein [Candidatus Woesearchaeota archaeon]
MAEENKYLAAIWIRGTIKANQEIKDTIKMLGFKAKNNCLILENTPSNQGMLKKLKDYITWGEVDNDVIELLKKKRKNLLDGNKKMLFSLHPPIKGFEKGGIKKSFSQKGSLGYRGKEINHLIRRMVELF